MAKLKRLSGREVITILCNKFGFFVKSQKGSHVLLVKVDEKGKRGCVVPLHPEVNRRTLRSALRQAQIDEEEFARYV